MGWRTCGRIAAITFTLLSSAQIRAADEAPKPHGRMLLIVAPESFREALADYVKYKKTILPTQLVTLEDVLKKTDGVDDPEKIKRYAYDIWHKHKLLGYLLLVGDRDVMPMRYLTSNKFATFDYLFCPTDLYYGDLAKEDGSFEDWNGRHDGVHARYFGEVNGAKGKDLVNLDDIHFRPEIAVGRWPVSTVEQAAMVAAKSMRYEQSIRDGSHPGLRSACWFHPGGWIDAREQIVRLTRSLPTGWRSREFFFADDNPTYKTEPAEEPQVLEMLNRGVGLCVHCGHGEPLGWMGYPDDTPGKPHTIFNTYHSFKFLHNADRLPVIVSIGCSTSYLAPLGPGERYVDVDGKEHAGSEDKETFKGPPPPPSPYQKGRIKYVSLGKQLLRDGPDGAVAYIGADMVSQPWGMTLLDGFIQGTRASREPRVGDCWAHAISYYYKEQGLADMKPDGNWERPAQFFQPMKYILYGDPSLPIAGSEGATTGK